MMMSSMNTMRGLLSLFVTASLAIVFLSGCGGSPKPQKKTTKARIIIDVPATVKHDEVKMALKEVISLKVDQIEIAENFTPDILPNEPGAPVYKNPFAGSPFGAMAGQQPSMMMMGTNTEESFYSVKGKGDKDFGFRDTEEYYVGAVYLYKEGARIYIYQFFKDSDNGSFMASLSRSVNKKVAGADHQVYNLVKMRDKFLASIPNATVIQSDPSVLKEITLNY
jgi:hypothetical protein